MKLAVIKFVNIDLKVVVCSKGSSTTTSPKKREQLLGFSFIKYPTYQLSLEYLVIL